MFAVFQSGELVKITLRERERERERTLLDLYNVNVCFYFCFVKLYLSNFTRRNGGTTTFAWPMSPWE